MSIQHTMSSRIARRLLGVIVTVVLATMTQFSGVQAGEPTLDQPTDEIPLDAVVHLPLIMTPHRTFLPLVYARPPLDRPYPANDATRQSLNSYLSWEAVDARLQGASYTVYLERDDATPDEAIVAGLTKTAYDPFTLEENTRYYWQVTATAADGQQFNSPVWSFTTDYFPDIPETDLMVEVPAGAVHDGL
jgi:hypothetical protein